MHHSLNLIWLYVLLSTIKLQDSDTATVIIFQRGNYGMAVFDLFLNEKKAGKNLSKNTSLEFKVKGGPLYVKTKGNRFLMETNEYLINIEENRTYFLEAYVDYEFSIVNLKIKVSNSKEYEKVEYKLNKIAFDEPIRSKQ